MFTDTAPSLSGNAAGQGTGGSSPAQPGSHAAQPEPGRARPEEDAASGDQDLLDFVEHMPACMHQVDGDGRILWANQAELAMLGYSRDEYVGRQIQEFHVDAASIEEIFARLRGGREVRERPGRLRCKSGAIKEVLISSSARFVNGQLARTRCITWDVTAQKQVQAERDAELAASRLLHEASTELIRDDRIETVFGKIMGAAVAIMKSDFGSMQMLYPERGVGGELKLLASHGFPEEAVRFWEWVRADSNCTCGAVLRLGHRVIVSDIGRCDFMAGTADQTALLNAGMLAAQSTPLISRNGRLLGMISTHWRQRHQPADRELRLLDILARQTADLIERTEVANQLRRAKQVADEASRAKDKFLAVLSHELRTPLTPVLLAAGQIERRSDLPPVVADDIAMIRRNVELQSRLIDDLLDISRIMNGKLCLESRRVSLNETIRRAAEICQASLKQSGAELILELAAELPEVNADGARLQQVFWNLLSNGAKFTQAGGRIRVRTEQQGINVRATVEDNGRGIEAGEIDRLFDAFEQGETGITREFGGLGLGLAISRAIVEQHGGRLYAFSPGRGRGSTFTVELPALVPLPAETGGGKSGSRSSDEPSFLKILLVEDHSDTARVLKRMLAARGHAVEVAHSGSAALRLAAGQSFDIVVSDLGLPDMRGSDMIQLMKARHPVRAIAMSGYGMEEDIQTSRVAGFEEHLIKPVKLENLEAALGRILVNRPAGPEQFK